ncbi:MAG: hypothetical protein K8R90_07080 [Candidatus Cloacimonetes bacterium]|nr:hypothetical protein [Candidatus Cloacimonadota bacterium]
MGQQQILLIVLGVILIGIALAIGISMFRDNAISSNRDAISSDLSQLAANAYRYKMSSSNIGGGGGSYAGMAAHDVGTLVNENATYTYVIDSATQVTITATGAQGATPWIIECEVDGAGRITFTVTQTGSY